MSYLGQQLGQGQAERFVFTASGGETSVTTSDDGRAIAYTVGQVDVYLNGAKLINGSDFTATTGTSITGLSALTASDVVEVFALSIFQASDTVSAASGGTFNGNVTMAANLSFGDNNKAIFGAGSDLEIYSDGTHSIIQENGPGALYIQGTHLNLNNAAGTSAYITAVDGGAVTLFSAGSAKLATTSTGIDVTGTVTADGLTVDGSAEVSVTDSDYLKINHQTRGGDYRVTTSGISAETLTLRNGASQILTAFANNGDISFYEDTGTTPKFFWDASAESLGIGTTSPSAPLHVGKSGAAAELWLQRTDGYNPVKLFGSTLGDGQGFKINVNSIDALAINSSGNVGIGTTSPGYKLDVNGTLKGAGLVSAHSGATEAQVQFVNSGRTIYHFLSADGSLSGTYDATGSKFIENYDYTNNVKKWYTSGSERMRIDSAGNVGIGTSSPDTQLHVYASSGDVEHRIEAAGSGNDTILSLKNLNTGAGAEGHIRFMDGSVTSGLISYLHNAGGISDAMTFSTAGSERARIDSSGNLLVGTTSAFTDGSINSGGSGALHIARDNERCLFLKRASSNGTVVEFFRGSISSPVGSISIDASSTTYNTSSDARLKENIADAEDASSLVDAIKVRQFDWKADGSHQRYGMVAQELLEVAPEAVSQGETEEDMMGVDYSKLVPMLVKEIQSLRARVAQLEGA